MKQCKYTYVASIFNAVLPEVSNRELLSDDDGGPEAHHEADPDDAARGGVQRQRVVEH